MNGYDIDGVLTAGVIPQSPYVVVSGRTIDEWDRTVVEIGTAAPIYLRPFGVPGDRVAAANWKAAIISHLGIAAFFEDDPLQASIISAQCPHCRLVLISANSDL